MTAQLALVNSGNADHYTPLKLARACVAVIAERIAYDPTHMDEPCLGPGVFVQAAREQWPAIKTWGCDTDPSSPGFGLEPAPNIPDEWVHGDCRAELLTRREVRQRVTLSNMPWSTLTKSARELSRTVTQASIDSNRNGWRGLLLPAGHPFGGLRFRWLRSDRYRPAWVHIVPQRHWAGTRETAWCIWPPDRIHPGFTAIGPDITTKEMT